MQRIVIAAALWLLPVSLCAQWLAFRTPGIPRTADGKPNLTAPAPRTPDGKPDFSGLWQPEVNPFRFDVIQDLKDESIFRPAAEALFMKRVADFRKDDPVTNCLPAGPSEMLNATYRIMQSPTIVALLFESGTGRYRQIHMDGRRLPEDPNPTWLGYSVGHWEGDTLVVADTDMLENVCNESTWDKAHMVGTANTSVELSSAVLAKYAGRYGFLEGSRTVAGFMGMTQNVTLANGQLFLNALPLIPISETQFESTGAAAEFLLDANGTVRRLVLSQTEGDAIYDPKR